MSLTLEEARNKLKQSRKYSKSQRKAYAKIRESGEYNRERVKDLVEKGVPTKEEALKQLNMSRSGLNRILKVMYGNYYWPVK